MSEGWWYKIKGEDWGLQKTEENMSQVKVFKIIFWEWGSGEKHCGPSRLPT